MGIPASVDIEAPASVVWKWVTDPDCLTEWLPGLVSDELIDEKEGHVGSRFKQVWNHGGRDMEMEGIVREWVENERVAVDLECSAFSMTVEDDLVHTNGVTTLTQTSSVRYKGCMILMGWFFNLLMKKKMIEQTETQLQTLKELCEGDARGEHETPLELEAD